MDLKTFWKSLETDEARKVFSESCGTTWGHMRNCAYGKPMAPATCVLVEQQSAGVCTRRELRPDDWHRIWPELVDSQHPAPAEAA